MQPFTHILWQVLWHTHIFIIKSLIFSNLFSYPTTTILQKMRKIWRFFPGSLFCVKYQFIIFVKKDCPESKYDRLHKATVVKSYVVSRKITGRDTVHGGRVWGGPREVP